MKSLATSDIDEAIDNVRQCLCCGRRAIGLGSIAENNAEWKGIVHQLSARHPCSSTPDHPEVHQRGESITHPLVHQRPEFSRLHGNVRSDTAALGSECYQASMRWTGSPCQMNKQCVRRAGNGRMARNGILVRALVGQKGEYLLWVGLPLLIGMPWGMTREGGQDEKGSPRNSGHQDRIGRGPGQERRTRGRGWRTIGHSRKVR